MRFNSVFSAASGIAFLLTASVGAQQAAPTAP